MIAEYLISTNAQKALYYLLMHPGKMCYEREIARGAKISYGSAHSVLTLLYKKGVIRQKKEGRICYYTIDISHPVIKEFKILSNLLLIEPLVERLKPYSHKIILYGSWAQGTDAETSDIDLFIVTSDEDTVKSIVNKVSSSPKAANRSIQAVITTPADLLDHNEREKIFNKEVEQGKILWEKEINEDNL